MPRFGPISRQELIGTLRQLGFDGPYSGGKHQFMVRAERRLRIPNPHQGAIGKGLLMRLLNQAGIDKDTWEAL